MTPNIAVVQLGSGLVVDLPEDTVTFDLPAGYEVDCPTPPGLEFSRPLLGRVNGEEFLVESGWSSTAPRGDMVLTTLDPEFARAA
ncbi:MAG: hypothetical protein JST54_11700 [Deltaproteobacteria bacterium]|nr:hypothetical protein [Deltaproteobacteria bacterium]